jgi:A/G-specific adenine glycosylase
VVNSPIAEKLLRWYASRRRSLPWRERPEPYAVWVAEIMAQQTRLESMLPYYRLWMKRFPTINKLAKSDEQDVLNLWEGLGYYSRARSLRRAAQAVIKEYSGKLPGDLKALRSLPGIGPYTAGAIASLAFGLDTPAVDGNAIRVLARVFDVDLPIDSGLSKKRFWELAAELLPPGHAADYNQALMDLGAEICKPRQPKCGVCPLKGDCRANSLGIQEQRPVKMAAKEIPLREYAAAVIHKRDEVLLVRRPSAGLLGGMWEFPNTVLSSPRRAKEGLRRAVRNEFDFDVPISERLAVYEHAYSHFRARLQVYDCPLNGKLPKAKTLRTRRWLKPHALSDLPMGKLDRQIANALVDRLG